MTAASSSTQTASPPSTSPRRSQGLQTLIDLYKSGAAPADSVNWGFNEIVAGFYSGTCAFLDQDPDALIGIADQMDAAELRRHADAGGPRRPRLPDHRLRRLVDLHASANKDVAWNLVAHLSSRGQPQWAKRVGVIPIHTGADQDPLIPSREFAGWFETCNPDTYSR